MAPHHIDDVREARTSGASSPKIRTGLAWALMTDSELNWALLALAVMIGGTVLLLYWLGCAFVEFRSEYRAYKAHYLQTKAAAWQSTLTQNDGCEPRQV